jgi:hypothetical protein
MGANNLVRALHWLYAGGIEQPATPHGWLVLAAHSNYRPLRVLAAIANRRDVEIVHRETKRVRNVMRYGAALNPAVHKVTFLTDTFGLGCLQGGILQPIQQRTWKLGWRSGAGADNPVLFSVHPYADGRELAMFFPEDPHHMEALVDGTKKGYSSPDKWVSSSPYERVRQDRETLLVLYDIPAGCKHEQVSLYWPHCLRRSRAGDWWLGRDGEFAVAVAACQPGAWEASTDHDRLRCQAGLAGFAVIAARCRSDAEFAGFREAIDRRALPRLERGANGPRLLLAGVHGGELVVDFEPRGERDEQMLFDGPLLSGELDRGVIRLGSGGEQRVLDFESLTVR